MSTPLQLGDTVGSSHVHARGNSAEHDCNYADCRWWMLQRRSDLLTIDIILHESDSKQASISSFHCVANKWWKQLLMACTLNLSSYRREAVYYSLPAFHTFYTYNSTMYICADSLYSIKKKILESVYSKKRRRMAVLNRYTVALIKRNLFYFHGNFGRCGAISIILSPLHSEVTAEEVRSNDSTSSHIRCYTTLWNSNVQLYNFSFMLSTFPKR